MEASQTQQTFNLMLSAMALLEAERENRLQVLRDQFSGFMGRPNARCRSVARRVVAYRYTDGVIHLHEEGSPFKSENGYLQRLDSQHRDGAIQWFIEDTADGCLVTLVYGQDHVQVRDVPTVSPKVVDGKVCP